MNAFGLILDCPKPDISMCLVAASRVSHGRASHHSIVSYRYMHNVIIFSSELKSYLLLQLMCSLFRSCGLLISNLHELGMHLVGDHL